MKLSMFEINPHLERYPKSDNLQAWDAADELILQELNNRPSMADKKILILGDSFGALTIALKELAPLSYVDSFVS